MVNGNHLEEIINLINAKNKKKHDDNQHKCCCDKKHDHGKKHDECEDCCIVTLVLDQVGGPDSNVVVRSFNTSCMVNCMIMEGTTPAAEAIACLCEQGFKIVESAQVNPNRPVLILRRCSS
ncbi:hypothetical protein [Ureibacillus sinduriensis]|uniref:Uncharacterized protein n=1 Tax=Ureibacillus sinduriensis BLB-1 = JCM 15800 TaxID=1384057 RepID=A0A0A3I2L0_9BACL|nr:hypothetical protein [Ureibacillus sinduriensis]KGR78949.1 hypothetical protein CD33_00735 [Ureibacillus sinduriensis BLB-1 = JCM 15800]